MMKVKEKLKCKSRKFNNNQTISKPEYVKETCQNEPLLKKRKVALNHKPKRDSTKMPIAKNEDNHLQQKEYKNEEPDLSSVTEATVNQKLEKRKYLNSRRQQKKKKFVELQVANKLKSETVIQQAALNYLSLWKHNRTEWKFKKLKQIWLRNHILDINAIPDKYWEVVTEYFNSSKGKVRQSITDDCVKVIEENESEETANNTKFERARCLLQLLAE